MTRHGITGQHDHNTRDQVALGPAVALPAQPHAQETGAPPDNTHGCVLQVIMHPGTSPAVLSEGIDTSPSGDHQRVEELLTAAGATQPELPDKQHKSQQNAVRDERASHDKMRKALSQMVTPTVAHRGNPTKEHLRPAHNRHHLAANTMQYDDKSTNLPMNAL